MLASYYLQILLLHVGCVALSGVLFAVRGVMRIGDLAGADHRSLRWTSYVVDSILLGAAVLLSVIVRQYPFVDAWLTTKVLLLPVYIVLGTIALRRARTRAGRAIAFVAALLIFGYIVGVALAHDPAGWVAVLHSRLAGPGSAP
jgi:uncharacterized membrane protein SirB2